MTATPARYAFSVGEWHVMGEAGIFDEDSRVELVDGEVVCMAPIASRHLACVNRLTRLLVAAAGDEAVVSVQNPVRLGELSEPQPDLVLLRPRPEDYDTHGPVAADTLLVVEVADSSLAWDRDTKATLYAAGGVPVYWVVDLAGELIIEMRHPGPSGYADLHLARRGEVLGVDGLVEVQIAVGDVLGATPLR